MTAEHRRRRASLTVRLVAAFVGVAVLAVVAMSALTLWRTQHTVGRLADERQQATARSIAETLALAYGRTGDWGGVDVHPALMIALQADATIAVRGPDGSELSLRNSMPDAPPGLPGESMRGPMGAQMPHAMAMSPSEAAGPRVTAPVVVDGTTVGSVEVGFASSELASAERHVRDAISGTVLLGALVAAVVAAAVAVPLGRRVIRPLRRLTDASRRVGAGDPTARAGHHDAAGELGELARSFDAMADRLERTENARRAVVTDLAHELRTPLAIVQAGCEEIIDGIVPPSLDRIVEMHDDLLRLARLVDDLGALADADAARAHPGVGHAPCDLATIAAAAARDLRPAIDAHQHEVVLALEPAPVVGDEARLRQVITNLLTNAVKYTPAGGHLALSTGVDALRGAAVVRVSDNGPGVDPADRPHVFDRFYRAPSSSSVAGSGIGLAVVDGIVASHGGTVELLPGDTGAVFEVRLPTITPTTRPRATTAAGAATRVAAAQTGR